MNFDGLDVSALMFSPVMSFVLYGVLMVELIAATVIVLRKKCPHEIKLAFLALFAGRMVTDTVSILTGSLYLINTVFEMMVVLLVIMAWMKVKRLYGSLCDSFPAC